jgi:ATP-dependent DNA helicase RecG
LRPVSGGADGSPEILAEQHYRKLSGWLEPLGLTVCWLSGSLRKKQKDQSLLQMANGEAQLAVGTHALFQDGVSFSRLGLVIVDEQHRFGVGQRLALKQKGQEPHQLMMSATPIPRPGHGALCRSGCVRH